MSNQAVNPAGRRRPRRRPAGARALAAARVFHEPLAGRGWGNKPRPRPGQTEPSELDDDVPEVT